MAARVPAPSDELVVAHMREHRLQILAACSLLVLDRFAKLTRRQSDENHLHFRRREMPVRRPRRNVVAIDGWQVLIVMATRAFHCSRTTSIRAALDELGMGKALIVLQWRVTGDMTILASWMLEHRANHFERAQRVARRRLGDGEVGATHQAHQHDRCAGFRQHRSSMQIVLVHTASAQICNLTLQHFFSASARRQPEDNTDTRVSGGPTARA
ncbi:MAG: hypothetical protein ABI537_07935 [Casimicrobiaceae bacterium]